MIAAVPSRTVAVVGGGVIGLTCALQLARAGHRVRVCSADPVAATTSAQAAAIWFPYEAYPADRVLRWGAASLAAFASLTTDAATGVAQRGGVVSYRDADPDLGWTAAVSDARPAADLAPGIRLGVRCTVPVIDTGRYLAWLEEQCAAAGVTRRRERIGRLVDADPTADIVVLAAGLASGQLAGDDGLTPIRGQVVRLANPGLTDWILDDDNPAGLTYVVPRFDDVVCGGTAERGVWSTQPDPATEEAILDRARRLVPELADAPIVSRGVGLRPGRAEVRLERTELDSRMVVCCYGHGGAGVTLSWGCADDVVALVG